MFAQIQVAGTEVYGPAPLRPAVNRSGSTLTQYGVYTLDMVQGQAESTTAALGDTNLVAVATANMCQPMVVAQTAAADNASLQVAEGEGVICTVLVESTTDIAKGDPLKTVNGQAYLVKATVGTDHWNAVAREARTDNDTGLISVLFYSTRRF